MFEPMAAVLIFFFFLSFISRVTPACALTFVVYENVVHFLMPLSP